LSGNRFVAFLVVPVELDCVLPVVQRVKVVLALVEELKAIVVNTFNIGLDFVLLVVLVQVLYSGFVEVMEILLFHVHVSLVNFVEFVYIVSILLFLETLELLVFKVCLPNFFGNIVYLKISTFSRRFRPNLTWLLWRFI